MNDFGRVFGLTLAAGYALALMPFLLLSLAIPYAVLRLRSQEGTEADTQVGLKVFFYYFFSLGVLLVLAGATILAVDAVADKSQVLPGGGAFGAPQRAVKGGDFNAAQRTGASLVVTGILAALFHWVLAKAATNDRSWPAARRLFAGWRLAIHGLVLLMTATVLIHDLFQEDTNVELVKSLLAVAAVWSFAWLADLFVLWFNSRPPRPAQKPRRALLREVEEED
jgi:hypothetical protein